MNDSSHDVPSADPAGLRRSVEPGASIPRPPFRWRTRILLPGAVLLAAGLLLATTFRNVLVPGAPVRATAVVLHASSGPAGAVSTRAAGWIEPDPFPIYVSALADGIVSEVLVLEGEAVTAGQVLVRLVDADARLALERAEADLRGAEADRDAARITLETLVEARRRAGVAAAAGESAAAAVRSADAAVALAETDLLEATEELSRDEVQRNADAISEFTLVRSRLRRDSRAASLEMARAGALEARAAQAERDAERIAAGQALELRIDETRALRVAEAMVARAGAERDEARLRLHRMEVRAPVGGVVMRRLASPGSKLMAAMDDPWSSTPIHLYDPAHLQVRVDVPLADASRVGVGSRARISVETLPDLVLEGEVTRVLQEADLQKNTVQFKVRIAKSHPELRTEMLARVEFLGRTSAVDGTATAPAAKETVWAPEAHLERTGTDAARAWVLEEGRAVRRDVALGGGRRDGWVEVLDGLRPGDRVLHGVPADLESGDRVSIVAGEGEVDHGHD
jgi:multidrug resistance efflux pump